MNSFPCSRLNHRLFPSVVGLLLFGTLAPAQTPVTIHVNATRDTGRISKLIYGTNGQSDDRDENITARRIGGNRLTGYNWENNASNAGTDYLNESDNYLTWITGTAYENNPGIVCTQFHDTSIATNCYSIITLPTAGYVAADKNGVVDSLQTAPSSRWKKVVFAKGSAFTSTPDTGDGNVYNDEEVNFFVNKYGAASSGRGVNAYECDNEPALWPSTHPRIHPQQTTCAEVIGKSVAMAKAVKAVDPSAEIFGPAAYGFSEYYNNQSAPDWSSYSTYDWYLSAYLAALKKSSDSAKMRLLDALDVHWYPEAQGADAGGNLQRTASNENDDPGVAWARMQAPRSLWDSSYAEDSWIGIYFSPIALLPHLNASIQKYYPGTKLAFTEFNYGGDHHISGGIAVADVLGLFGKYGVYMSSYWGPVGGYVSSAYKIYRNFDGARSTFGDVKMFATTSDPEVTSVYAASEGTADSTLHLIIINKDTASPMDAAISITSPREYAGGRVWSFDAGDSNIKEIKWVAPSSMVQNVFHYTISALTVCHFVLQLKPTTDVTDGFIPLSPAISVSPNPSHGAVNIAVSQATHGFAAITIRDVLGNIVRRWSNVNANAHVNWEGASGVYCVEVLDGAWTARRQVIVVR